MKLAIVLSTAVLQAIALSVLPPKVRAVNYFCYWRQSDGSLVDLSPLCRQETIGRALTPDEALVADFGILASKYPETIRRTLITFIGESRNSAIASAKVTCRLMKFLGGEAVVNRRQRLVSQSSSVGE